MVVVFITSKSIIFRISDSFGKILKIENEIQEKIPTNNEKQRKNEHEQVKSKNYKRTLKLKDINPIFCILTKTLINWLNKFPRIQIDYRD